MRVINIYKFQRERTIRRRLTILIVLIITVASCFAITTEEVKSKDISVGKFVSAEDMLMEVQYDTEKAE